MMQGQIKMKQRKWNQSVAVIAMLAAFTASVLVISGCHSSAVSSSEASSQPSPPKNANSEAEIVIPVAEQRGAISTTTLAVEDAPDILQFPGKIVLPDNENWHVGVLTTGRIERVYANLGDYVHKGEVLARMHSHDVHEARAEYQMAIIQKAQYQSAESLAQVNYDRMQRLYNLRAASVEQTEQAREELVNAKTALEDAQINLTRSKTHLEENLGIPADTPPGVDEET